MKYDFYEGLRDSTVQSIKNGLGSTRQLRYVNYLSNYICEKLEFNKTIETFDDAIALIRQFHLVKNEYENMGLPLPNILNRTAIELSKKLKNHLANSKAKQKQSTSASPVLSVQQLIAIRQYTGQFEFKKKFSRESIEASTSLKQVQTIKQMLYAIQKQGQQTDVCLGCLKQLEEGKPMPETTQLYSLVNGYSINNLLEDDVKKKACALLNGQGGYLFIGESINKQQVKGLTLNEGEMYQLKKFVQKTIKKSIFPSTFEIKINTIQTKKSNGKISKLILLISLRPSGGNGFYFVEKEVPKYPSVYSCYFLDTNAIGEINDVCVLEKPECIYNILTKHRGFKNTEQIVHKLGCVSRNNAMQNLIYKINLRNPHQMNLQKLIDPGPVINYCNQSILILASDADDKYIPSTKKALQLKTMNRFIFSKSYELCRTNSKRSTWFISHQYSIPDLQSIITEVIVDKSKPFTLITCTKYLLIEKKQKSQLKQFLRTFASYFSKDPQIYEVLIESPYQKEQIYDLYICFDSFSESYFSFMLLEDYRIRSKFIKQQKLKQIKQTNYFTKKYNFKMCNFQ